MVLFGLLLLFLTVEVATNMEQNKSGACVCAKGKCKYGWTQYKDACYKPFNLRVTWPIAEEHCTLFNSHMASVHSREENDFVFSLMKKQAPPKTLAAYWLGGHDLIMEGVFMWTDGTKNVYNLFGIGDPDNMGGIEYYITVWETDRGNTRWADVSIHHKYNFVCKYTPKETFLFGCGKKVKNSKCKAKVTKD